MIRRSERLESKSSVFLNCYSGVDNSVSFINNVPFPRGMATMQEIIEKANIEFPKPISVSDAEVLFMQIAKELPVRVDYAICRCSSSTIYPKCVRIVKNTEETISGRVTSCDPNFIVSDSFGTNLNYSSPPDDGLVRRILFDVDVGSVRDPSQFGSETLKLWDNVRKVVEQYFKLGLNSIKEERQ